MRGTRDPYFDWLCIMVGIHPGEPGRNYSHLVQELHQMTFKPIIEMDRNRASDGLRLRVDFLNEHGAFGSATNRGPCTMLELLIGLARQMSFLVYEEGSSKHTEFYFWRLIDNLGLSKVTDDRWEYVNGEFFVGDAVWRVNERQYTADGSGGLFPLKRPSGDQRKVEIWYQMNAWLMENSNAGQW